MKKIFFSISILLLSTFSASAQTPDDWYLYTNSNQFHPFTIQYPNNWQVHSQTSNSVSFSPANQETTVTITEFQGIKPQLLLTNLKEPGFDLISQEPTLLKSRYGDLIITKVLYANPDNNEEQTFHLIPRGKVTFAFNTQGELPEETFTDMLSTIRFTDQWHQYFDFQDDYTFIFPKSQELDITPDGVKISNIFSVTKHQESDIKQLIDTLSYLDSSSEEKKQFNDFSEAYYFTSKTKPGVVIIILPTANSQFVIQYQKNSLHTEEILNSFRFFELSIEGSYSSFIYFPDVRNNHPNSNAINNLFQEKTISGYPDGTFGPDLEINRAEFTKMIVAAKFKPDQSLYQNCFPDVQDQWFSSYICYAKKQGWVQGFPNGEFKPNQPITRVEALKILFEAHANDQQLNTQYFLDPKWIDIEDQWYLQYFKYADANDLFDQAHVQETKEGVKFFPAQNITRKEVAELLYRTLQVQ